MLKQGSRSGKSWHDRYFQLLADGNLRYFHKAPESAAGLSSNSSTTASKKDNPKASLDLQHLPDCEISDLFVAKRTKELLYCIKITWSTDATTTVSSNIAANNAIDAAGIFSDNESVFSGAANTTVILEQGQQQQHESISSHQHQTTTTMMQQPPTPGGGDPTTTISTRSTEEPPRKRGIFRKSKTKSKGNNNNNNSQSSLLATPRSVDRTPNPRSNAISWEHTEDGPPQIPDMVEVQDPALETPVGESQQQQQAARLLKSSKQGNNNNNNLTSTDEHLGSDEMEYLRSQFLTSEKESKRKTKQKIADGAKLAAAAGATVGVAVVTVGIGLVAGLVALGIGAAAGASGTAAGSVWKKKQTGVIVMGSSDYDKMRRWKACLDASLNSGRIEQSKWGQLFVGEGNKRRMLIFPKGTDPFSTKSQSRNTPQQHYVVTTNANTTEHSPRGGGSNRRGFADKSMKWLPLEGGWATLLGTGPQGLRIFREERPLEGLTRQVLRSLSADERPCVPMKSQLVLKASPLDAFLCLMSQGQLDEDYQRLVPNSGQRSSFRIIEQIDDNTDVIHMVCNPLYLFPSWTTPRDFVLYRYWRLEEDGSFMVCYESIEHKDCPPCPGYCRGEMHQMYTVAPMKKMQRRTVSSFKDGANECLVTAVVQVDPKGWIPIAPIQFFSDQGYGDAFSVAALMQLLDVRDAIDQDRFIPVSMGEVSMNRSRTNSADKNFGGTLPHVGSMGSEEPFLQEDIGNYDYTFSNREAVRPDDSSTGITFSPPPLDYFMWAEPDANSFRVRGKTYIDDRQKINAGVPLGRLLAVDVVQVDAPMYSGFTTHPTERLQLALKKEQSLPPGVESDLPAFVFVVNIVLPTEPYHHGVFYYAIDDLSTIDGSDGSPSSLLCKEFFFGESDVFRNKTFKLIPQIVEGNFIVRKAVGSTPAIMGKKLKQYYIRTDRSFEVVIDCGSSSVATGVIRLSLGYAKSLTVDLGFLFEGAVAERLPERLMGCARCRNLDFTTVRKVSSSSSVVGDANATTAKSRDSQMAHEREGSPSSR